MIAYKGFKGNLTCTLGNGVFQYEPGQTITEESSKCARRGMHCTEYPLECFTWYPPCKGNRYFEVEAGGSIDECEGDAKIACTQMTLLRELSVFQVAAKGMVYMVEHPQREWEISGGNFAAEKDRAEALKEGAVAIARGRQPRVRGVSGAVLGLVKENAKGMIVDAKVFVVRDKIKPGIWYTIRNRILREVEQ